MGRPHALHDPLEARGAARWDDPDSGVGSRVPTLRDRLPADLRDAPTGPEFATLPFRSVYLTDNEWAAEMANRTVHSVMHMSWVSDDAGRVRGQMAVLVKPNGLFGTAYMAAIAPFRYLIVYPGLMRDIGNEWQAGMLWAGLAQERHASAPVAVERDIAGDA